jgi:hypothetical protein
LEVSVFISLCSQIYYASNVILIAPSIGDKGSQKHICKNM